MLEVVGLFWGENLDLALGLLEALALHVRDECCKFAPSLLLGLLLKGLVGRWICLLLILPPHLHNHMRTPLHATVSSLF
jgi:hypothetical protein